jgi:hypothetical protein
MPHGSRAVSSSGREGQGKSGFRAGLSRSRTGEVRTGGVIPCVSQSVPHTIVMMSRPERVRAGSPKLRAREIANGQRYADTCDIRLFLGRVLGREALALEVPVHKVSPRLPQVLSAHVMGSVRRHSITPEDGQAVRDLTLRAYAGSPGNNTCGACRRGVRVAVSPDLIPAGMPSARAWATPRPVFAVSRYGRSSGPWR